MDILIGREDKQNCLLIAVQENAKYLTATLGTANSVPESVSRCKPQDGTAHCKISVDAARNIQIVNLKPDNKTFVEDVSIKGKKITVESNVALGVDRYRLDISAVIDTSRQLIASARQKNPQPCDIRGLEKIYQKYEKSLEDVASRQRSLGAKRMLPMVVSMCGGLLSGILGACKISTGMYVSLGITAVGLILMVVNMVSIKNDSSGEERKKIQDWLFDNYVCPNTGKFLGNQPYKLLKQQNDCPHCRGKRIS